MNLSHVRERLANGFRPFVVALTNGRRFEVPHPEFLLVGKNVIGVLGGNDVIRTPHGRMAADACVRSRRCGNRQTLVNYPLPAASRLSGRVVL